MSDQKVQRQLQQMIKFIEFEAQTKEQEIRSNAEQECEREKSSFIEKERKKIENDYVRRVKEAEVKKRITFSQELSSSRLQLLQTEDQYIQTLLTEVREKLENEINKESYNELLVKLIKEGMKKVEDKEVIVRGLERDKEKVAKAIEIVRKEMNDITIIFDDKHFLEKECIGGVAIASKDERIVCNNTLEQRLNQALTISLPLIRKTVFPSLKNQAQKN